MLRFHIENYTKRENCRTPIELGDPQESSYLPRQSIALQNLGLCYFLNEDLDNAIKYFRSAFMLREKYYG